MNSYNLMMEEMIDPRIRVNGATLMQHIGKPVNILGTVISTHTSGVSVELKTVDNHVVTVKLLEPIQGPLSGLVEFHGTVQGKNVVSSDFYVQFDTDVAENFDADQYNEAIIFTNTIPNPWAS